jgi:hypothetical protein
MVPSIRVVAGTARALAPGLAVTSGVLRVEVAPDFEQIGARARHGFRLHGGGDRGRRGGWNRPVWPR